MKLEKILATGILGINLLASCINPSTKIEIYRDRDKDLLIINTPDKKTTIDTIKNYAKIEVGDYIKCEVDGRYKNIPLYEQKKDTNIISDDKAKYFVIVGD
jgi:hypothetical protein